MNILITGIDGFIGKNLRCVIAEHPSYSFIGINRHTTSKSLKEKLRQADFIVHLAGINRPQHESEFKTGNVDFTTHLCDLLHELNHPVPIIYSSSTQAAYDNPYGISKRQAEQVLIQYRAQMQGHVYIFRLPNVFGKWCKPNFNSVVATFCHNITRDIPININSADAKITLVYIDTVVEQFLNIIKRYDGAIADPPTESFCQIEPTYTTTVGELSETLQSFKESRTTLITQKVGTGFIRALHSTYLSYLQPSSFSYTVPKYGDTRGVFVEMLKTQESGQFSFFTAHPGITRGDHYHHSKTEKFLVIKGKARFRFRNILTNETYEKDTDGNQPEIVETVPGWTHNITNIGAEEMIVMLWANEIFDREHPDTYAQKV